MITPIDYADASPTVRAVYDDIKQTRNVPYVNNFWKYPARDPARPAHQRDGLFRGFARQWQRASGRRVRSRRQDY